MQCACKCLVCADILRAVWLANKTNMLDYIDAIGGCLARGAAREAEEVLAQYGGGGAGQRAAT
jgi:hypothetical protein